MSTTNITPEARRNKPEMIVAGLTEDAVIRGFEAFLTAGIEARLQQERSHEGNGAKARSRTPKGTATAK